MPPSPTRTSPFGAASDDHILALVCSGRRPTIPLLPLGVDCDSEEGSRCVPQPIAQIIQSCWDQDPLARPMFDAITVQIESAALGLQRSLEL